MPEILVAAIDAPTPEPQTRTPRSRSVVPDRRGDRLRDVGVVDANRVGVHAEVESLVPEALDGAEDRVAEAHAPMVEAEGDLHQATRLTASATASAVTPSSA